MRIRRTGAALLVVGACLTGPAVARPAAPPEPGTWVEGWAAAPISSAAEPTVPTFANRTVRLVVRPRAAGTQVRVRLSNAFGDRPVSFGHVAVGVHAGGGAVRAGTLTTVEFAGRPGLTVAAGNHADSDPAAVDVARDQDLVVSLYLPRPTGPATWHRAARQTNYVSTPGDHAGETAAASYPTATDHWFFLDAVSVLSPTAPGTLVAFGDSITDGSNSAHDANRRWPDVLADRLAARPGPAGDHAPAVVNEGVAGNRLLTDRPRAGPSALHRLTRDVLQRRGVRQVIVLQGVNDLRGARATAAQLIAGYRQLIARLRAAGIRVYGGTLTPAEGSAGWTAAMERHRQTVNAWVRGSGAFDAVIDFAAATQDPADPLRLRPAYDGGDHLHPNDAGYEAMGTLAAETVSRAKN
jgi:lysophospholipase L1-like esterase